VKEIRSDNHRVVTRLDGQAAMNALRSEQDGPDVAATAPATIVAVKARTFQERRSDHAGLAQADRAGVREAGVTYRYPWSIDEQSAHRVDRRHLPPTWCCMDVVNGGPRASAVTVLLGGAVGASDAARRSSALRV